MKVLDLRKKQEQKSLRPEHKKPLKRSAAPIVKKSDSQPQKPKQKPVNPEIQWQAPSFYFNPQKRYLSLVIIALALGGGSMLLFHRDTLTAIFLVLSSFVLILYSNKRPEISDVLINQSGVAIGDTMYYYKELRSFWIHYNPGDIKELSLESKRWYMPYVKVSIGNKNPINIRSLLVNFLPEKEHEHSLVDIVSRKIGL